MTRLPATANASPMRPLPRSASQSGCEGGGGRLEHRSSALILFQESELPAGSALIVPSAVAHRADAPSLQAHQARGWVPESVVLSACTIARYQFPINSAPSPSLQANGPNDAWMSVLRTSNDLRDQAHRPESGLT